LTADRPPVNGKARVHAEQRRSRAPGPHPCSWASCWPA